MELRVQDWVLQIDFVDRVGLAFEVLKISDKWKMYLNEWLNVMGIEEFELEEFYNWTNLAPSTNEKYKQDQVPENLNLQSTFPDSNSGLEKAVTEITVRAQNADKLANQSKNAYKDIIHIQIPVIGKWPSLK